MRVVLAAVTATVMLAPVHARELYPGQYDSVDPQVKEWFRSQRVPGSGILCCSEADGTYAEEDIRGTHYWTRWSIDGAMTPWQQVPEEVVLPHNKNGSPVVWWMYQDGGLKIRCFAPGGGV